MASDHMKPPSLDWTALAGQYRRSLLEDVIPFWLQYSVDEEYGGYLHHLDRDGSVFCTDKMMWMQGREVWMLSRLFNSVEKKSEWLEAAALGARFLRQHGRDEHGGWFFAVNREGVPIKAAANVYSDLFAVMGLSEFARASGETWAADLAAQTFWQAFARRDNPKGRYNKDLPHNDGCIPGGLALQMMLLCVACQLQEIAPDNRLRILSQDAIETIVARYLNWSRRAVFENAWPDNSRRNTPAGRLMCPGHAIETMSFVIELAAPLGIPGAVTEAVDAMLWMLERGWDAEYGGLYYFLDIDGRPPEQLEWSMKLWWPHAEALYASLLAYMTTGRSEAASWFEKLHGYTWDLFPDPEYGEWFGYFDRQGQRTHSLKGGKWKGCFHVPRALLNCWKGLETCGSRGQG